MGSLRTPVQRLAPWLIAGLAMCALASCSSSSKPSTSGASGGGTVQSANPSSASSADSTAASDLATRVLTDVPSGFVAQPDNVGDTGPSDLAKAVRDDGDPNAQALLTGEGFLRGYQRLWRDASKNSIVVFLYEFHTPDGAKAEFERKHPELTAKAPAGATEFTVNGLPFDVSGGVVGTINGATVAAVDFASGVYSVRIEYGGPTVADAQATASSLALQQLSRL